MNAILPSLSAAILSPLNLAFLVVQGIVFVLALRVGRTGDRRHAEFQAYAPNLLTGLGILGTFVGIFVGLLGLDATDLDKSVVPLLEGMKTAFLTSVVGLTLSIVLRWILRLDVYRRSSPTHNATIAQLYETMLKTHEAIQINTTQVSNELVALRSAIVGDKSESLATHLDRLSESIGGSGDSTVVGQVKLLRQDLNDRMKDLTLEFSKFAGEVSKLGTQALIEALSEIIRDFNAKLTEQFGDNFKELNSAVTKLVVWQENYSAQIESMTSGLKLAAEGIAETERAVAAIAENAGRIPEAMQQLRLGLEKLDEQMNGLDARFAAFAQMGQQAVDAFPIIEGNISRLTTDFTGLVSERLARLASGYDAQEMTVKQLEASFELLRVHSSAAVDNHATAARELVDSLRASVDNLEKQLRDMHARSTSAWETQLREAMDKNQEVMQKQISNLDEVLQLELQRSIEVLSRHLLGLHEKLIADYTPLTERLRSLIELARRVDDGKR